MKKFLLLFMISGLGGAPLWAMPSQITFQGTLKMNGKPVTAAKNMVFSFVDSVGNLIPGTKLIPIANVQVTSGLFAVQLPLDPMIPWEQYSPFIHVIVENENLGPDQPINANLYAAAAIPQGMIALFAASCPTGWSEYAPLQGRFPVGEDPNSNPPQFPIGQPGGNAMHSHTLITLATGAGGSGLGIGTTEGHGSGLAAINGGSNYTIDYKSAQTDSQSNLPPYLAVVYCQKQ